MLGYAMTHTCVFGGALCFVPQCFQGRNVSLLSTTEFTIPTTSDIRNPPLKTYSPRQSCKFCRRQKRGYDCMIAGMLDACENRNMYLKLRVDPSTYLSYCVTSASRRLRFSITPDWLLLPTTAALSLDHTFADGSAIILADDPSFSSRLLPACSSGLPS